ncbi:MAG TPA: SIMPL domain-containing protein [Dehalococcoidia bacterium]|nr:SIMPL domain-containing protein [Dehalococcoidia bacterium]
MKKLFISLAGLMLLSTVLLTGCAGTADGQNSQTQTLQLPSLSDVSLSPNVIWSQQSVGLWVNGEGRVKVTPDVVLLGLGVDVQKPTVAEAQRQAAESMDRVMKELKNKGVADKDIQTQQYSIYPVTRWDDKNNQEILIGYRVSNMVTVKIRKIADAGGIIDAVAAAAGNDVRINSINFSIDDPMPYQKQAREKAVADAMERAKQIASVSGIKLGKVLYVTETGYYAPVVRDYYNAKSAMGVPAPETAISGGELEVSVSVQMVYNIN